jgi:glycine/D-amino acid oxidase-like deaminating enzyme
MTSLLASHPNHIINLDIAIIGGGVAGLWLANRAKKAGYRLALFEANELGSGQTMASQGMIHGGMKYTLSGALTDASETLADMPNYWRSCLCGEGDVDLRNTRILSDHFYMWSGNDLGSKITSFFASKITRGRIEPVSEDRRPPLLRHPLFTGTLYRLDDIVLDVHSLVANLVQPIANQCFKIDWSHAELHKNSANEISLIIKNENQQLTINAKRFIFTAGKGNADLLAQLNLSAPAMQLRPLQQVMVKNYHPFLFYGHCLGVDTVPRLTISSHKLSDTEHVWYLGGSLAERGASLSSEELIALAQQELSELIPWMNLENAEWATLFVDRAEPLQPNFIRPDNAFVTAAAGTNNLLVGWPTKLTLAPNLSNQVLHLLETEHIYPENIYSENKHPMADIQQLATILPLATIAKTPWELAFPPAINAEEFLALKFKTKEFKECEE